MDYFGINSAADLPKIKEVLADQIVEGTMINPEDFTDQNVADTVAEEHEILPGEEGDISAVAVNEDGELIIEEIEEEEDNDTTPEDESPDQKPE